MYRDLCVATLGMLAVGTRGTVEGFGALLGGILTGISLGILGFTAKQICSVGRGIFYTPNARLGVVLSVLLVARIGYRFLQRQHADGGRVWALDASLQPKPAHAGHRWRRVRVFCGVCVRIVALAAWRRNLSRHSPIDPLKARMVHHAIVARRVLQQPIVRFPLERVAAA